MPSIGDDDTDLIAQILEPSAQEDVRSGESLERVLQQSTSRMDTSRKRLIRMMSDREVWLHEEDERLTDENPYGNTVTWLEEQTRVWQVLAVVFEPARTSIYEESIIAFAIRFTQIEKNLVAGWPEMQDKLQGHVPLIVQILFWITNIRIEEQTYYPLQIQLTQLLGNLVFPLHRDAQSRLVSGRFLQSSASGAREQDIIIRLLDSPDDKVIVAVLSLLYGLVAAEPERQLFVLQRQPGVAWLRRILARMDEWRDSEQPGEGRFEAAKRLMHEFIKLGYHREIVQRIRFYFLTREPVPATTTRTMYKLIDSYIAEYHPITTTPSPWSFLISDLHSAVRLSIELLQEDADVTRLPDVLYWLIQVVELLNAVGLEVQGRLDRGDTTAEELKADKDGDFGIVQFIKSRSGLNPGDPGVICWLIDMLKTIDDFSYKRKGAAKLGPTPSAPSGPDTYREPMAEGLSALGGDVSQEGISATRSGPPSHEEVEPGHMRKVYSSSSGTIRPQPGAEVDDFSHSPPASSAAKSETHATDGPEAVLDIAQLSQVRSSIISLLTTLTYHDTATANLVREYDGLPIILSLAKTDFNAPVLRERALMCIRNLLLNNPGNWEVVKQMDPVGLISDLTGEILPLPKGMKRGEQF